MPTKTWAPGEEVAAADMNAYLQRQVVSTFASAAARDLALPSPTQGMIVYLADVQRLEIWNGTAWVTLTTRVAGRVFQTVTQGINPSVETQIPMGSVGYSAGGIALAGNGLRVPLAGFYQINGVIGSINGTGNSGIVAMFQASLWGSSAGTFLRDVRYDNGFFFSSAFSTMVSLAANEIVTLNMFHNAGSAVFADMNGGNQVPSSISATLVSA